MSMRMLTRGLIGALAALVAGGMVARAEAGTLYKWQTEDGVVSFTDDARRIPERYRSQAQRRQTAGLASYERFTPTDARAAARHEKGLEERLERLRVLNGEGAYAEAGPEASGDAQVLDQWALGSNEFRSRRRPVRGSDGKVRWFRSDRMRSLDQPVPQLALGADPESSEPVVMEEMRVRDSSAGVTRHVQVIRQGDRILGVIKPRHRHTSPSWTDERELE